ncbi:MAG: prepilin peptidase [Paracoccaceae bacterium]
MQISQLAAAWFLPFAVAIGLWVAWSDMKFMKIPNKAVLALGAVFLCLGPILLPFDQFLWQLAQLAIILAIGFVLNMVGLVGAGDAKFAAVMAPFVALGDLKLFLAVFASVLLAAFVSHRSLGMVPAFRRLTADWESWERKDFPMGLALAGVLIFYLVLALRFGS